MILHLAHFLIRVHAEGAGLNMHCMGCTMRQGGRCRGRRTRGKHWRILGKAQCLALGASASVPQRTAWCQARQTRWHALASPGPASRTMATRMSCGMWPQPACSGQQGCGQLCPLLCPNSEGGVWSGRGHRAREHTAVSVGWLACIVGEHAGGREACCAHLGQKTAPTRTLPCGPAHKRPQMQTRSPSHLHDTAGHA